MSHGCLPWHAVDSASLLARYGLQLSKVTAQACIPGSYWGDSEAGLVADTLYVRGDTPLHSLLHETAHYICMSATRRAALHTDAGSDDQEETAVCYLQIRLAEQCGVSRARMFAEMDAWGYSFRLGSTRAWFEQDAQDACRWLQRHNLLDADQEVTWRLRG
ncbi:MAG: hypothetical protein OEN20_08615 [Gammaproteobacteria bacterium]|nr:hypothetical protein [Gammaproteobacteria bacterium]